MVLGTNSLNLIRERMISLEGVECHGLVFAERISRMGRVSFSI